MTARSSSIQLNRTSVPLFVLVLAVCLSNFPSAFADRPVSAKLDESIDRALVYLTKQQRTEGWFDHQVRPADKDADASRHRRAITGLCTLTFLSAGHVPDAGRHGAVVRKAVDALVNAVPDDGYIGKLDEKPMYTQAIVTLAIAQAYGVEPRADRRLKQYTALVKLVGVITAAQQIKKETAHTGGWRYTKDAVDSDLSLSGWNALALRAAQDAGLKLPQGSLKQAADYVAQCYAKDQRGFAYQPGGAIQAGTTATGVLCMYLLEVSPRVEAAEAAASLASRVSGDKPFGDYPYYGMFYLAQAAGQADDEIWKAAAKPTLDKLVKAQEADGGWPGNWPGESGEPGRVYRTAMATLALTVPYRVLPIYQR